jgi:hypothetical protein
MRITCVLRSGGLYEPRHVLRLYEQAQQFAPQASFLCLTDLGRQVAALGVPALPLKHDWPIWWAKMCAYALPGPNLQLDLDVTILGDLTPLLKVCAVHELVILRDFRQRFDWVDSSVVGWSGSLERLTRRFDEAPEAWMSKYAVGQPHSKPNRFGDQAFIADQWYGHIAYWQEALPWHILSYKKHWRPSGKWPIVPRQQCRILVYHSWPKPWDPAGKV